MTEQNGAGPAVVLLAATPGTTTSNLVSEEQRADIGKFDRFYSDYRPPNDLSLRGISLTGELDLGGATLKSITAYRTLKQSAGLDFDATDKAIANYGQKVWQNQFSQELQLNGSSFDGALDWITGAYFLREKLSQELTLEGTAAPATLSGGTVQFQDVTPLTKSGLLPV